MFHEFDASFETSKELNMGNVSSKVLERSNDVVDTICQGRNCCYWIEIMMHDFLGI